MLISAMGENLGSRAHAAFLEGGFLPQICTQFCDFEVLFVPRNDELVHCALRLHEWTCRMEFVPNKLIESPVIRMHILKDFVRAFI